MNLHGGKNSKLAYYLDSYWAMAMPAQWLRRRRGRLIEAAARRDDYGLIRERVDYCCRLEVPCALGERGTPIGEQRVLHPKVYYLDSLRYARYFDPRLRWHLEVGDVNYIPDLPSIVKSRPVEGDRSRATLLNLDRVRHFVFLSDRRPWREKRSCAIFRGAIGQMEGRACKENRYCFMERFFGHPRVDAGEVMEGGRYVRQEWACRKMSLYEHLDYKFILALEGNDVASNLKWVMSSNSLAVMPRPRFETWFMEGRLRPGYHYVEIADDFADLEEKMDYYIGHPEEAEAIVRHAHEWVNQFRDGERERLVSLLVLEKYLRLVNP